MADLPRRGGRNRPDSRQMWDESERRNRHGPGARDRREDRDAYREDGNRDKDRRHRSRSRSPRGGRRDRHRSRSRERRDRDRDRDSDRQQQRPRRDDRFKEREREREREKERGGRRDDDDKRGDFKPRPRDVEEAKPSGPPMRDPNRGREPRRSASPGLGLPTRPKEDRPRSRGAGTSGPLTFKVGKHEDSDHHSRSRRDDRSDKDSPRPEERNHRAMSRDNAMMDVDEGSGDYREEGEEDDDDVEVADDGLAAMQAMMGFGGFGTTKGTHVAGNNAGAIRKEKKIEYRQYMNRVGGFNRPLSPGR